MAIAIVLERYPVGSIRDVDGAFDEIRTKIGGEMLTLDDIENRLREMPRRAHPLRDRLRVEVLPAARSRGPIGRPASAAALDAQGRAFVNDPTEERHRPAGDGPIALSKIFEWNRKEFERDGGTVGKYIAQVAARSPRCRLARNRFEARPNS